MNNTGQSLAKELRRVARGLTPHPLSASLIRVAKSIEDGKARYVPDTLAKQAMRKYRSMPPEIKDLLHRVSKWSNSRSIASDIVEEGVTPGRRSRKYRRELQRQRAKEARARTRQRRREGEEALKRVAVADIKRAAGQGLDVLSMVHNMRRELHSVWGTQNQGYDAAYRYAGKVGSKKVVTAGDKAHTALVKALDALKEFETYLKAWEGNIATALFHAKKLEPK